MKKNTVLLVILSFLSINIIDAQDANGRYTKEEIAIQDKFVEAKKYALIGRYEKSEEILKQLYKEDRNDPFISLELSKVYTHLEKPFDEHLYAEKAFKNDPNNEYIAYHLAEICIDQGKYDEAKEVLMPLVTKYPLNEEYSDQLAGVFLELNDDKSAIQTYTTIESKVGVNENISRRKFDIYSIQGKKKEALNELQKLSDAFPNDLRFLQNLAGYQKEIGKGKEAIATYQKILSIDKNDPKANLELTLIGGSVGDENNYLRSLGPIIEDRTIPLDKKVLELIPYVEELSKTAEVELGESLSTLADKLVSIHNKDAKAFAIKGDILSSKGNLKGAAKAYEKTIEINDNIFPVWENIMSIYSDLGEIDKLKTKATDALDLFPNQSAAYMYYGEAYARSNDLDEAEDILKEGLLVSGKNMFYKSNINAELGRVYHLKDDLETAQSYLDKALSISDSKNAKALELFGDLEKQKGNMKEAIKYWTRALDLGAYASRVQEKINKS